MSVVETREIIIRRQGLHTLVVPISLKARGKQKPCTPPYSTSKSAFTSDMEIRARNRGRLVKDRATGKPKITCRNWECGVVMAANGPPSASTVGETHAGGSHDEYGLFDGRLPVPMQVPGIPYIHPHNSSGTDLPWFHHDG